jgi:hypothetical protein
MIVFSVTWIFWPVFTAVRTSSSQTKGTGEDAEGGEGADGEGIEGAAVPPAIPREARNASIRRVSVSAEMGSGAGFVGGWGNRG